MKRVDIKQVYFFYQVTGADTTERGKRKGLLAVIYWRLRLTRLA